MRVKAGEGAQLAELVGIIWSDHSPEELTKIIEGYITSENSSVFAQWVHGQAVGVALCGLRYDYVEGCETSPVGYLEGVSVRDDFQHQGIARRLVSECEQWAKEKGCSEFASDCELTNTESLGFHLSIGFQEENRIICFRKTL